MPSFLILKQKFHVLQISDGLHSGLTSATLQDNQPHVVVDQLPVLTMLASMSLLYTPQFLDAQ